MNKFFFSLILACVLTTAVVFQVIAGAVLWHAGGKRATRHRQKAP